MREIKFRAWNKSLNANGGMIWNVPIFNGKYFDAYKMETHDHPLMQYTGLTDKNGKEIYEGDILKDTLGWVFEVRWDDESGRFLGYHSKPRGDIYICYVGREPASTIIGNIWENPELMK